MQIKVRSHASADAFTKETWVDDIEARVEEAPQERSASAVVASVIGSHDDDDQVRVAACLSRFGNDVVNAARLAYVEATVVGKARQVLDDDNNDCDSDNTEMNASSYLDRTTSLVELGVTSQDAARLQQAIVETLGVEFDVSLLVQSEYTLSDVAVKILDRALGKAADDQAPLAEVVPFKAGVPTLGPTAAYGTDVMQALLVVVIAVVVSIALIPAYHWGLWVQWKEVSLSRSSKKVMMRRDNAPWSHVNVAGTSSVYAYGLLVPLVIPVFMVALSLVVIAAKWVVVGRYRQATTTIGTGFFLRWWFLDRLLDLYEIWVGVFNLDTILMNLFCVAMGGDVAMTARVKRVPREFDLVSIGDRAVASGSLYCRLFQQPRILRFEGVVLGSCSEVASTAVVMPRTTLDRGAVLEDGGTTSPGMHLKANVVYHSSPARVRRVKAPTDDEEEDLLTWLAFEMAKVTAMGSFLYTSFVTSNVTTEFLLRQLDWYAWSACGYREFMFYSLAFFMTMFLAGIILVLLKWILVGRRVAGHRVPTDWTWRLRTWFLEWIWYRILGNIGLGRERRRQRRFHKGPRGERRVDRQPYIRVLFHTRRSRSHRDRGQSRECDCFLRLGDSIYRCSRLPRSRARVETVSGSTSRSKLGRKSVFDHV